MTPRLLIRVAAVCWGVALAGCGPRMPTLAAVEGAVTLDGKPLGNAMVIFVPDAGGRPATAQTTESGRYRLIYGTRAAGATLGRHRVSISKVVPGRRLSRAGVPDAEAEYMQMELVPARYLEPGALTAEVVAGRNVIDFALTQITSEK
jgi:hypothetical protein